MTFERADLSSWLALAEDVARHHRQGRVLATDPALVLRGLPPLWRPATGPAGPADDVVALAGAALARLDPHPDDPLRPPLVEAAAGCLGPDLPALLRVVRPLVGPAPPDEDLPAVPRGAGRPGGRRLALAGALGVAALAVLGLATAPGPGGPAGAIELGPRPTAVGGQGAQLSWRAPHVTVETGDGRRYRYRLEGEVEAVAAEAGAAGVVLVVAARGERWELAVPALDATGPGSSASGAGGAGPGQAASLSGTAGPR